MRRPSVDTWLLILVGAIVSMPGVFFFVAFDVKLCSSYQDRLERAVVGSAEYRDALEGAERQVCGDLVKPPAR